jgi:23S rRNA pseudouridine1911/1915/1917 synthase
MNESQNPAVSCRVFAQMPMMLAVVYEDADIAVLNKPAGIPVHPAPQENVTTLADEIIVRWPEIKTVGEPRGRQAGVLLRPGIVHRLDKETSGVLVIAKNQRAYELLTRQFSERKVKKTYLALVVGEMPGREGTISLPIGRSRKFGKFTTKVPRGNVREALTFWKKLGEYKDRNGRILTLLEVRPETGRTHQIRVHLAAIGHPVAGDRLYGGKIAHAYRDTLGRHFLHAASLELTLPSGGRMRVEAELPRELQDYLNGLEKKRSTL